MLAFVSLLGPSVEMVALIAHAFGVVLGVLVAAIRNLSSLAVALLLLDFFFINASVMQTDHFGNGRQL